MVDYRPKHAATFNHRPRGGFQRYGDLNEDTVLGSSRLGDLKEADAVPGSAKTLGQLTEDDLINTTAYQQRPKHASSFTMKPKH